LSGRHRSWRRDEHVLPLNAMSTHAAQPDESDLPVPGLAIAPARSAMTVLASGSGGNCSLLRVVLPGGPRHILIDLGLSPRRTRTLLASRGVHLEQIDAVLLTHLDSDHCHGGWCAANMDEATLPRRTEVFLARSHSGRAQRMSFNGCRFLTYKAAFTIAGGVPVAPIMMHHDELGAGVFRFTLPGGSLGFATDLGRATDQLVAHLRGTDVLAIESNYCPVMQQMSDRPEFLKRRIMGGRGHLSNEECARAVSAIGPRREVVLLHLSRRCNTPDLARAAHVKPRYRVTLSTQDEPTPWVTIDSPVVTPRVQQLALFG